MRGAADGEAVVYVATCSVNGKIYIGITSKNLKVRKRAHLNSASRGSPYYFHRALRKYGANAFVWEVVAHVPTWQAACAREIALIQQYDTRNPQKGYNSTSGGEGSLGVRAPDSVLEQISQTLKAWHASDDQKAKALREKVSHTKRGSVSSLETRLKQAEGSRNRPPLSDASRAKLSASKRKYSDEVVTEVTAYALEHGFRAAERQYGIPRPTIRRWTWDLERLIQEKSKMSERNRTRQYRYAFPVATPLVLKP